MIFKKHKYLYFLPFLFLLSCAQDDFGVIADDYQGVQDESEGTPISFIVEGFETHTRSVDFSPNSTVKINTVWMGIFDRTTGECVARESSTQGFLQVNTDEVKKNLIRLRLAAPPAANQGNKFFAVCVVNYLDVIDENDDPLEDRLAAVSTWNQFIDIAVDTKTAYTYPHDADAPIMAGFMRAENVNQRSAAHVQVDQFKNNVLYPDNFENDIEFGFQNGSYVTSGKVVVLRRMVANINATVSIDEEKRNEIKLTRVRFKRFNLPEKVFIIERRTVGGHDNLPPEEKGHETNFADRMWWKSGGTRGYTDDAAWDISPTFNSDEQVWKFSFQHFANKHWARRDPASYSEREARRETFTDDNGNTRYIFSALTDPTCDLDPSLDWNNNASYFVINMHLVEENKNRCAEAEYMIHEGNTSDALGVYQPNGNLSDYVCARNISYSYNVNVKGFNNIFVNVDDQEAGHHPDQGGKIWQMYYANDPTNYYRHYYTDASGNGHFEHISPPNGSEYNHTITFNGVESNYICYQEAVKCGTNPNLAFRLWGYSENRNNDENPNLISKGITGYNYNFEQISFQNLEGLWPPSAGDYSHYFKGITDLDITKIPEDLRYSVLIKEHGNDQSPYWDIVEFIQSASIQTEPKTYDVYISKSNISPVEAAQKEDYIRAIYIADRKGVTDADGCSTRIDVFCAAQEPPVQQ